MSQSFNLPPDRESFPELEELDVSPSLQARLRRDGFVVPDNEQIRERAKSIMAAINPGQGRQKGQAVTPRAGFSKKALQSWMGYSATALALAIVIGLGINYTASNPFVSRLSPATSKVYTTNPGQRATITLTGGSRVAMGPATAVRVRQEGHNPPLGVDVSGEALFTINQSNEHPFVVTAHGVAMRVLGTEFVVRAYDASMVRIAVRSGKVSVQSPALTAANAVVVSSNQVTSVVPDAVPQVAEITDLAPDFGWTEGQLVLRNVPLGEALVRMSRWYGKEFRVADSALLELHVETVLPSNYNPGRIKGLAKVLGARVTQSGSVITFSTNHQK